MTTQGARPVRDARQQKDRPVDYVIERDLPIPDLRGGQPRKPSAIRDAVAELIKAGVPTPEGKASALWFAGITDKAGAQGLAVRRALSQLQKAGAEFGVTVVRHWEPAHRTIGRKRVAGSEIRFYVVPRMAGPGKRAPQRVQRLRSQPRKAG